MKSVLLLTYCLAIGIPLGLAIWSKPKRNRIDDQANVDAKSNCMPEAEIVETIEALAIALRSLGDEAMADNLLSAFYGASTGTEMRMDVRYVMRSIDRRELKGDVALLIRAERLLS